MRPCPAILLLAAAGLAGAETVPATAAAAAVEPAAIAAPDPGPTRARRAPAAPATEVWNLTARSALGWDSNPILESSINPDATGSDSALWSADLAATIRLIRGDRSSLALTLGGEYVDYPSERTASLFRASGGLRGSLGVDAGALGRIDPGAIAAVHGFWTDDGHEASAYQGSLFVSRIDPDWIAVATAGATRVDYPDDDELSGTLVDGGARVMLLARPGQTGSRLELGLRGGRFAAGVDRESYTALQPSLIAAVRGGGDRPAAGVVDLTGRMGFERRWYDEDQTQGILTFSAGLDRWFSKQLTIGAVMSVTDRDSSLDSEDYDRLQFITRASYTW